LCFTGFDRITQIKMNNVVKKSGQNLALGVGAEKKIKVRGLTRIGGWYYYRPAQIGGIRPPRVSLDTQKFEVAVQLALEMKRGRGPEFTPGTLLFEGARFLRVREELMGAGKLSRWTYVSDESVLKLFREWAGGEMSVRLVSAKRVEDWLGKLRKDGLSKSTVRTYLLRLHAFFAWLVEDEVLPRNVVGEIELPVVRKTRADQFCTRVERERLLGLCEREDLRLMLMLGFHAGLRLREMIEARPDWLRFWEGGGEIHVRETVTFVPKDKEERRIPMNRVLYEFLSGLKFEGAFVVRPDVGHAKHKYRWEPRKPFARLLKVAGLEWVGWHTLRHTFATLLIQGGCPIATVAQWLGDGIEVTFKNYAGYAPVEKHVNAGL
jgi:integrase